MAIYNAKDMPVRDFIDLTGPEGNVFYLLGMVRKLGKRLGLSDKEMKDTIDKMTSGDYENAVQTFDDVFGDFVDLYR